MLQQSKRAPTLYDFGVTLAVGIAPESDGRVRIAEADVMQQDLRQPNRQRGTDYQKMERSDWLETEQGMRDERKRRGVPELRGIGLRIGAWCRTIAARISADAFRDTVFRIDLREIKKRLR